MCSWLIIVDMRRTESARVKNKALKIAFLNLSTSRSDYLIKVK